MNFKNIFFIYEIIGCFVLVSGVLSGVKIFIFYKSFFFFFTFEESNILQDNKDDAGLENSKVGWA